MKISGLRFPTRDFWGTMSFGLWHPVVEYFPVDVSKKWTAFIFGIRSQITGSNPWRRSYTFFQNGGGITQPHGTATYITWYLNKKNRFASIKSLQSCHSSEQVGNGPAIPGGLNDFCCLSSAFCLSRSHVTLATRCMAVLSEHYLCYREGSSVNRGYRQ